MQVSQNRIFKKKDEGNEKKNDKDTVAVAHNSDVYIVYDDNFINFACQNSIWIIDSGVSYHVTPRRDFFSSYIVGDFATVKMRNEGVCEIVGMGDFWVETGVGCKFKWKNVRYVPNILLNLIFVKALNIEGYQTYFDSDGMYKITIGLLVVTKEKRSASLYRMSIKLCKEEMDAIEDASSDLWHTHVGHLSEK